MAKWRRMFKRVNKQWLPTHISFIRAGDVVCIEGFGTMMANSDPYPDRNGEPSVKFVHHDDFGDEPIKNVSEGANGEDDIA